MNFPRQPGGGGFWRRGGAGGGACRREGGLPEGGRGDARERGVEKRKP